MDDAPIEPLRISFEVECAPEHAFDVWTRRIGHWWPADHTVTVEPDLTVVLEGRQGGRIFERTRTGQEHDWGRVTVWEPPTRLAYLWHLRQDPAEPTEVDIRFVDQGPAGTRVDIEHRGWDRITADGRVQRDRNMGGWSTLLPHFVAAAQPEDSPGG